MATMRIPTGTMTEVSSLGAGRIRDRTPIADRPLFTEIPLDGIEQRLLDLEKGNSDVVIPAKQIDYTPEGLISVGGTKFAIPNWPFRQIAKLCGMSARTLRQAPDGTGKASRHALITYWLDKLGDKPILLRLKETVEDEKTHAKGRVRGVLSTGGKIPLSARDLLSALRPHLRQYDMAVQLGNARDQAFHVRTLFREGVEVARPKAESRVYTVPTMAPSGAETQDVDGNKDTHAMGVHWRMSEVGFCAPSADLLIFRVICSNGLIATTEKTSLIDRRSNLLDEASFRAEVGLAIEKARDRQNEVLEKLTVLRDAWLTDPKNDLKMFLTAANIPYQEDFVKKAVAMFEEEPIASRYGVLQAITRAARAYHPDTRIVYEALAGSYMEAAVSR